MSCATSAKATYGLCAVGLSHAPLARCHHLQALAATFGYAEHFMDGFSASPAQHAAVSERLVSQRQVADEDAVAVVQRVKELVVQVSTAGRWGCLAGSLQVHLAPYAAHPRRHMGRLAWCGQGLTAAAGGQCLRVVPVDPRSSIMPGHVILRRRADCTCLPSGGRLR
jgi:hypothetical protein